MAKAEARGLGFVPVWIIDLMTPRPLDPDKNRVILFTAFMILGLPTAVGFGLYNLFWTGQPYLAAGIFVFGAALFFTWTKVRNGEVGLPVMFAGDDAGCLASQQTGGTAGVLRRTARRRR